MHFHTQLWRVPFSLAALLICSCIASSQVVRKNAAQQEGERAFATNCAGCHGLDGTGGERAPDIVTRPKIRQLSNAQLLEILRKGVNQTSMPAFNYLGEDVLHSLVDHLRVLQGDPAAAPPGGNPRHGREVFFGKGACSECHMIHGQGGFFASDLTVYSHGRAAEAIRDAIVFPNRDLDPRNRTVVATLPGGAIIEGLARNEDNFSIQLLTRDGVIHLLSKPALLSLTFRNESPMPADYGKRLSASELDDLVSFLASFTARNSKTSDGEGREDDE